MEEPESSLAPPEMGYEKKESNSQHVSRNGYGEGQEKKYRPFEVVSFQEIGEQRSQCQK